jgi:hypothetical protein
MMTQQDFEKLAAVVKATSAAVSQEGLGGDRQLFMHEGIALLATRLMDMCQESNPRFSREKFIRACFNRENV